MRFENAEIELDLLPKVATVDFTPLPSNFLTRKLLGLGIFQAILFIGMAVGIYVQDQLSTQQAWIAGLLSWVIIGLLRFWATTKGFRFKGYALRERDLMYRSGWLWHTQLIVPFNRVQHCAIHQGPLDKLFQLATLKVFTAGTDSSDLSIPGLHPDRAQQLKEFLLKRTSLTESS
ncbi:MAG: PH domain-containing protein [Bacteroidota bacterium]